jgi:AraC-like DNA-binding protein
MDIIYTRKGSKSYLEVVGTMTVARDHSFSSAVDFTGLRFLPGKALNFPAAELVDQTASLDAILPIGDLHRRLDDASDAGSVLTAWLTPRITPPNPVELALSLLEQDQDIDSIASAVSLSGRQFRRRCAELTGLSPRHLARILRFRKACNLANQSLRPDWAGIAIDTGYFDQAHLIRDFREFTGETPMSVFSNTPSPEAL